MAESLFDKYGGFAVVSRIVLSLYDKLLEDDEVGPFFDDVDLPRLVDHQTKFVSALMGGPASFSDEQLQRAHARLDIRTEHFDRLQELIRETLEDFDLEPADIDTIVAGFEARRSLLIG